MTCIIAYTDGKISFMAGDKLGSDSTTKSVYSEPKIFVKEFKEVSPGGTRKTTNELVIGGTTSFRMLQILEHCLTLPDRPSDMNFRKYLITLVIPTIKSTFRDNWGATDSSQDVGGGNFLILYDHEIYEVYSDFSVLTSSRNYAAVGCGAAYANAAMAAFEYSGYITDNVEAIFKIVSDFSPGVSDEYDIIWSQ